MGDFRQEFQLIIQKMEQFEKEYKRKLLFLGFLNKYLKMMDSNLIVLGGFAVQFYTAGEYLSKDIDIACSNPKALGELLISIAFKKIGRHYYSDELEIALEIPTSAISKREENRVLIVEIEGYEVPLLGLEDIIIDRLNAFTHWQSLEDGRLAKELLQIHFDEIDWDYLQIRANEEKISLNLHKMKEELDGERKNLCE